MAIVTLIMRIIAFQGNIDQIAQIWMNMGCKSNCFISLPRHPIQGLHKKITTDPWVRYLEC